MAGIFGSSGLYLEGSLKAEYNICGLGRQLDDIYAGGLLSFTDIVASYRSGAHMVSFDKRSIIHCTSYPSTDYKSIKFACRQKVRLCCLVLYRTYCTLVFHFRTATVVFIIQQAAGILPYSRRGSGRNGRVDR
ncbi:hypothetical protein [Paenibacillus sp. 37]|uniref:hypothetical protein n=1 Tax=Paenibacillus sp. 37 TaxID=2607911 RepID=UPI00122E4511|nr:hypothetical protein [Paenibacillus sp. 37]